MTYIECGPSRFITIEPITFDYKHELLKPFTVPIGYKFHVGPDSFAIPTWILPSAAVPGALPHDWLTETALGQEGGSLIADTVMALEMARHGATRAQICLTFRIIRRYGLIESAAKMLRVQDKTAGMAPPRRKPRRK